MRRRTALMALAATPLALAGPSTPDGVDASEDVDILQRAFELLHPGLLRYASPADVSANLNELRRRWRAEPSLPARYLALSQFSATLRCGHTYANFFNQSRAVADLLFERDDCLPLDFQWLDGRMIVTRNLSADGGIAAGDEVATVNGVPAGEILARLLRVARADGSNDAKRVAWLQVQGDEPVEAFDVFWPQFFPGGGGPARLELIARSDLVRRTIDVRPMTTAARRQHRPGTGKDVPWTLNLDDPALAVMHMPTWALYDSAWDWRGWLASAFDTLASRKIPALAIDLRANEGGLDVGDALLGHLVETTLALPSWRRLVRYRRVPDDLLPYLDTWDHSFRDWGDRVERFDGRFLRFKADSKDAIATIAPCAPHYAGRVFALVGPTNSSATFEFAARLQASHRGLLVGEPTGGNLRGINGGAFFFLRLPRTGLEIDLPLIGQLPDGPLPPDRGLMPDVLVRATAADIAARRDSALLATRTLARMA